MGLYFGGRTLSIGPVNPTPRIVLAEGEEAVTLETPEACPGRDCGGCPIVDDAREGFLEAGQYGVDADEGSVVPFTVADD